VLFHQPGWRNGRRTALKMRRGRPREGSNPSPGTLYCFLFQANEWVRIHGNEEFVRRRFDSRKRR
jgi:hypothetical protein